MDLESLRFHYLRRVVGTALKAVGIEAADGFGRRVAGSLFSLAGPGRRRAEDRVQGWLDDQRRSDDAGRIVREMYEHIGRFWVESLFVGRLLRATSWRRFVDVPDISRWREIAASGRGCLIATGLYGHPGVLACALGRVFGRLHVVADQIQDPAAAALQNELYRVPCVVPLDRATAATEVPQLLERGRAVMIISESERATGRACEIRFLGRRIRAYPTLARLARSFDVPIVPAICRRGASAFRFEVLMNEPVEADASRDESEVVGEILGRLERLIGNAPEQYLWMTPVLADRRALRLSESGAAAESDSELSRLSA
ncbi:MAG TPA: hypothetical protein VMV81_01415 [Phycisphaerae bacterium]|nr:hypothetical protein [Phycisphaerae bacterium]